MDQISKTSLMLKICFNEIGLATATGFVIKHNGHYYLATNKHVVTGRDPVTEKIKDSNAAIPNCLVINHYAVGGGWILRTVMLYHGNNDPNNGSKKWLEHPDSCVDVVLLPIEHDSELVFNDLSLIFSSQDIIPVPAMPISIVGFPFGRSAGEKWPIWVTGFIASEPDIDVDDKPLFYICASGRGALSGSPVFLRLLNGTFQTRSQNIMLNGAYVTKFMGIYSGRIGKNVVGDACSCEYQLDVCRVWKPIVFEQIFAASGVV